MKILFELSWLWKTLGIALAAAAVCVAGALLLCRALKKKLSRWMAVSIGAAAFVLAMAAVLFLSQTPALIQEA